MLGTELPVLAAPMAGGPTTPELVVAAADVGSLGFLAAGYLSADQLAADAATVRASTAAYGVNLFAPNPVAVDPAAYAAYREQLLPLADRYGVELPVLSVTDDDGWDAKVEVLLADPPPVVSTTFGLPTADSATALRRAGVLLAQTVTSLDEARRADAFGVDLLVVQSAAAGGHSGTFAPDAVVPDVGAPLLVDLLAAIRNTLDLPLIAAGGVAAPTDVRAALGAGASAVLVGTALLLAPEAGTPAAHRKALAEDRGATVVTTAFTGRPARALPNELTAAHPFAPLGYPAVHHLTRPVRRAAAAAGSSEHVNLWAGTGYRSVVGRTVADTLRSLAP